MFTKSAQAIVGPGRRLIVDAGYSVEMCSAKAAVGRIGPAASRRPSSSITRAPAKPSSPGWNISSTRPPNVARRSTSIRAAPRSIATWVSWPQACIIPSVSELKSRPRLLGQRQGVHVAPQEDGRAGTRALDHGGDRGRLATELRGQAQLLELLDDQRLGRGQHQAALRLAMEPAADRDDLGKQGLGGRQEGLDLGIRHAHRIARSTRRGNAQFWEHTPAAAAAPTATRHLFSG